MTDNQTLQTDTCPNCQHQQHAPGVECEGLVNHNGDRHWHRCLCLKRAGADSTCHPLMTCQGGSLGYSDIWHLQRGHVLQSADGPVTPDVLTAVPVSSPPPDQTALVDAGAAAIWALYSDAEPSRTGLVLANPHAVAAAVLAVLPPPADRAAVLLPAWEAVYEPGNVSDYLIGYANDQDAATGMAEAWMRSQAEVTGRLEWVPDSRLATGRYDRWFELIERYEDGVDTGPGIIVRRRLAAEAQQPDTETPCERCGHNRQAHNISGCTACPGGWRADHQFTSVDQPPADPWSISYHQLGPARMNPNVCTCGLGPGALTHNEPPHAFNGRPKAGMPGVYGICTDCHHHQSARCHATPGTEPPAHIGGNADDCPA